MKNIALSIIIGVALVGGAMAQTNDAAFFPITSPSNAVITELDPIAGTLSWSNGVAGVTNQLQRAFDLTETNGWADFVMLATTNGSQSGTERIIDLDPPEGMVLIPGGMNSGTNPLAAGESYSQQYPSNYVLNVSAFYMDATEVTKAQWDVVYNWATNNSYSFDNTGSGKASDHPVHTVSWYDCVKWCNARSEMEGKTPCYTVGTNVYRTGQSAPDCDLAAAGYRLPTSDEWEMAARGGLKNKRFGWGDTITHSNANYDSSTWFSYDTSSTRGIHPDYNDGSLPYTSPGGSFATNGYGLYDMEGNVWEWCTDWFPGYEGSYRVARGGGWYLYAWNCRTGIRGRGGPSFAGSGLGFRSVLPAN